MGNARLRPTLNTSPLGNGTFVRIKRTLSAEDKTRYESGYHGIRWAEEMDATCDHIGIVIGADTHGVNSYVRFLLPGSEAKNTWFYRDGWLAVVPEAEVPAALVAPLKQAHEQRKRDDADTATVEVASSNERAHMTMLAGLSSISRDVDALTARASEVDRKLDLILDTLNAEPPRSRRRRHA